MTVNPTATQPPALDKAHQDLKNATQQFESYFVDLMLKEMRKTVPQGSLMGEDSNQQQVFQDMMDQTLADSMSKRGDLGLGQMMYKELSPALGPAAVTPVLDEPNAAADTRR